MDELPKISQEEAKEKIKNGEKITKVYIERLSLSKFDIENTLEISECKIGTLDFNKSQFKQDFILRMCDVNTLVLAEAVFHAKCTLKKTKINRGKIQRVQFKGNFSGESAKLHHTSFYECTFEENVDFGYSTFIGDATFHGSEFKKNARWNSMQIQGSGVFTSTTWGSKADFRQVNVQGDLNFSGSTFRDELLLISSVIGLNLTIDNCHLYGKTDLNNVKSGRNISVVNTKLEKEQSFRFVNSTAPLINIERNVVEGHIFPENVGNYAWAAKEYAFLRTAFQNINRFDDEDWAYYQFKRMERKSKQLTLNPISILKRVFEYLFLDLGCGYGTMPFRTLGAVGILVVIFAFGYHILEVPANMDFGIANQQLNTYLNSLNTSLVVFSGGYGDLQISGLPRLLAMVEYLIGVVFMGLFVVAFSRKIIR